METLIAFVLATAMAAAIIFIVLRAAVLPERRFTSWARSITGPNGRYAFGFLLVVWVAGMAVLASLSLPANTVGGPALIGLFAGFFIFMGFIWSVIGE